MTTPWDKRYPDATALRREVDCMVAAYVGALRGSVPEAEVAGIYFKGSAQKAWDSPLDYVPELSDVDLHVLFEDDGGADKYLGTPEQALELGAAAEAAYFAAVPEPVHVPRPQLIVLNRRTRHRISCRRRPGGDNGVHGREYAAGAPLELAKIKALDARRLAGEAAYIASFPTHASTSRRRTFGMRCAGWCGGSRRPAPRALHLLGVPFADAWTANRTRAVALLEDLGEREFAARYSQFYLSGWDYFLSGYRDYDAARRALLAGIDVLRRGVEMGNSWEP